MTRSREVFAAWDGAGKLALGAAETLDADDCLAQMILHELCHSLVQGPKNLTQPDWGLDNIGDGDQTLEYACLRLQCALLTPLGLRDVLAPTTEHRAFYDALPLDALEKEQEEGQDLAAARRGLTRVDEGPWHPHLRAALEATRAVVEAAAPFANDGDLLQLVAPV